MRCVKTTSIYILYQRVQPLGLISISCNKLLLDNEIDQILVNIQLNPTGIGRFPQTSTPSTADTRLCIKKDPFTKKPCPLPFICHLGDLCTCFEGWVISVFVCSNFWQIFGGGWAETKTGFYSSSKQPILQPKRKFFFSASKFLDWILVASLN